MKPNTDLHTDAGSEPVWSRPARRAGGLLGRLTLAALGMALAIWILWPAVFSHSPSDAVAFVREHRTLRHGEDIAAAIEQTASQLLSPAVLVEAMRKTAGPFSTEEALAAAAENLRGRLRVDVDPSAGKQPWTISIRSAAGEDADIVNALAEEYCRALQATAVAERMQAYQTAQAATERARQLAARSQIELDRQIDRLAERAKKSSQPRGASLAPTLSPPSGVSPANDEPSQRRAEAQQRVAKLESQRAVLLERLLPAHPEVQAAESELETARAELNALPPAWPPATAMPTPPGESQPNPGLKREGDKAARELAALAARRKSYLQAAAHSSQLAAAERRAAEQALQRQQDEVVSMTPAINAAFSSSGPEWKTVSLIGLFALLSFLALFLRREHPPELFQDVDELESALGVPLVGMLEG